MERANTKACHARKERCSMWNGVWKLPVKPKLKYFLWKCIHDWLASNTAIKKRGVMIDEICRRSGMEKESMKHHFFHCKNSMLICKFALVK